MKFDQIILKARELAAFERLEKTYTYNGKNVVTTLAPSFLIESIIFILAGNEDMHENLDEFKFWPDTTTDSKVICPLASVNMIYNVVNTLALHF